MKDDELDFLTEDSFSNSALEDLLLIEALQQHKAEVFENIVFDGTKRYYIEDLSERDYFLESTTPYQIQIEGVSIEERNWVKLICSVSELLLNKYPDYNDKMIDFRCQWSKSLMFSAMPKSNFKLLNNGLYVNCNHTALHSCWFIQDLLDFFNIDKSKVYFLIHRPSGAEPKEVKEYIEKRFKRGFTYYLKEKYGKDDDYAEKVLNNIEKHLNKLLMKISKSYISFFLFDDKYILSNYVTKVRELVCDNLHYDERAKKILNKYLDYVLGYYKSVK